MRFKCRSRLGSGVLILSVFACFSAAESAEPKPIDVRIVNAPLPVVAGDGTITTSKRAVLFPGDIRATMEFDRPSCPYPNGFLVTGIHAAPDFDVGNTNADVVKLGKWGVIVATYQVSNAGGGTAAQKVSFNVIGNGPEHLNAVLPAGQVWSDPSPLIAEVWLIGYYAPARFEFSVHITGRCGAPFVSQF
jgi:hypothetical protein